MKKITVLFMLSIGLFAFYSCEGTTSTIDIPVASLEINLDDIVVGDVSAENSDAMLRAETDGLYSFSVAQTLTLGSIIGELDEVLKYSSIKSVEIESATITISGDGTVVKEFTLKSSELNKFAIDDYVFNIDYVPNKDLGNFAGKLLVELFMNNSATITASGLTDVALGNNLKVTITLNGLTVKAEVLKDEGVSE